MRTNFFTEGNFEHRLNKLNRKADHALSDYRRVLKENMALREKQSEHIHEINRLKDLLSEAEYAKAN